MERRKTHATPASCLSRSALAVWLSVAACPGVTLAEERIDTSLPGGRGVAWTAPMDVSPAIHEIAGVGDVDGDGLDDFAVGFLERPHEEPMPYAVFLVYGRPRLIGDVPLVPWLDRTWQVRGREPTTDRQSHQVLHIAPAGDIEGDGHADFFLGYASYPDNNPGDGTAVLVHGGPDLEGETTLEQLLDSDRVTVFRSSDPRYRVVGSRCRSIGDFNGDGAEDIAINAPRSRLHSTVEEALGATFLIFNVRDLPRDVDVENVGSTLPGMRIEGFEKFWEETQDFRGTALNEIAPLGDFNGDGLSDVALGANRPWPRLVFVVLGSRDSPSVLRLEEASTTPNVIEIRGPTDAGVNVFFGGRDRLAGLGDVNGDGLADFGVSQSASCCSVLSRAKKSWVQVFFGSPDFPPKVEFDEFDELDSSLGVRLEAVQQEASFGIQLTSAGDFDGDGRPDLLIGSPGADPEGRSVNDRGEAYVLSSRDGFSEPSILTGPFPGVRIVGAGSREALGFPVAPAGDFDGDGFDDVLVVSRRTVSPAERRDHPGNPRAYLIYGGPAEIPFTLADVRPAFGPVSGGTTVRLVGSGFNPDVRIFFGDVEATGVSVDSSIYLDVIIPPGSRGLVDVSVTLGAETATLESQFFYSPVLPVDLGQLGERGFTVRGPIGLGLGNHVAVDDFDGDGFDDLLLSACWTPDAEVDGCSSVLVRGRRDLEDLAVPDPSESTTTIVFPDPLRAILIGAPGDVNDDGIGDMFFAIDDGYGYIVFGRPEWPPRVDIAELFEAGGVTEVVSPAPGRMPVAGLGDLDGDGIDDFAVTILPDPLAGQQAMDPEGEIVFVAGRRSWESLLELPAQASGRIRAGLEANELGWEIVPAGDVNGDGLGDLLANSQRGPQQSAYLIYGNPALLEGGVEDLSSLVPNPERARWFLGISPPLGNYSLFLSGAGDVNGDGFSDVLIGLPQAGGVFRGRSYLILGATFLDNLVLEDGIATPPGVTGILGDGSTYANARVGRCGDLDGDGLDDFAVRAITGVPPNPGYVYILSGMRTFPPEIVLGRSGLESIRLDGAFPLSPLRDVADSVGDFNGDGADDVVVREGGRVEALDDQPATGDRISVIFGIPLDVRFVRGDTNQDATVNLADSVFLLQHLFAGGERPTCKKAADTNDDDGVDVADAVFLLNSLFAGGGALPEPHGVCGVDPTPDALNCEAAPTCR